MSNVVNMLRFDGSIVKPKDDAILFENMFPTKGLFYGGDITFLGSAQIHIAAGRGIYKGRDFIIPETTMNCALSTSGSNPGRVYIHFDLSDASTPAQILTVCQATLPDLEDNDDFNENLLTGDMELATYTASELAITEIIETFDYLESFQNQIDDLNDSLTPKDIKSKVSVTSLPTGISECTITNAIKCGNIVNITGLVTVTSPVSGAAVRLSFDGIDVVDTISLISTNNPSISGVTTKNSIALTSNGSQVTVRYVAQFMCSL